ncbi:MAG: hypothetical protein ACKOZU_00910 [Planctomycetaceae bacterium]
MQTGEIILLAVVFLVLLGGLVSLGVGHRRWSIGTVVAGFLVLLSAVTFLYLAAQLADRERAWARKVDDYRLKIAKMVDDQSLDANRVLGPAGGGPESLERLRAKRERWRRGLVRVDNWRDRHWDNASFQPPKDDASTGRVELAAEGNTEDSPPIGEGSHVFLFDAAPFEEGGAYLGEFLVKSTAYDQASKRHVLTVVQTSPRDAYDTQVLRVPHDSVVVYETLPVDRWLAFYRSREQRVDGTDAVRPDKQDPDKVRDVLESSPAVGALVEQFVETFRQHEEDVPKDEWEAATQEAADRPGTLWADVVFTKPHSFRDDGAAPAADEGPKQDFEPGDRTEFDLQTASNLQDDRGVVTIERVFRRRPLTDALTLLHGAQGQPDDAGVEGTATLLKMLQDELDALERSNVRLAASLAAARANEKEDRDVAGQLERDLKLWQRDSQAAAALAGGFERERDRTNASLRASEAAIVERGRELTALMTRLAREIDRESPPPERRAARP